MSHANVPLKLTDHAQTRMAQRNFTHAEVQYILHHGRWLSEGSDDCCTLRSQDIPRDEWRAFGYLAGSKVVIAGGCVKTLYRNRHLLS